MKYTVLSYIFGDYECVHEVWEKDPEADYIMVTDDPSLRSDTWRIILDERPGQAVMEKCYGVRFNPFQYAQTELCIRLDGSVEIFKSLRPIIDKMQQGRYDRCLMLHPRRYTLREEYDRWIFARNYPPQQAERCLRAVRDMGYPLDHRGLFQCTFEVVRNNPVNRELNERTLQMLHDLRTDTDIERLDQTIFTAVANHYFARRLKVLPVTQSLIQSDMMAWHFHNTDRLHKPQRQVPTIMFNRPCQTWTPPFKPSLRIYICTHTDFECPVSNPVYEIVDARQFNGDICPNGLHGSFYSELITYRYISQRKHLPDYVGFCGYRKYFSFMDEIPDIEKIFTEYDAIAAPCHTTPDVRVWYAHHHNQHDLDIVTDIIRDHYPQLLPAYIQSLTKNIFYRCNMFIVRREDFLWLINTVFDILDRYLEIVGTDICGRIAANPEAYHIDKTEHQPQQYQYQYRIGGFLGERIINALLQHRFPRIKPYEMVVTQDPVTVNSKP